MMDPRVASDLMRLRGAQPLERYPGLNKPWACECFTCRRKISARLSNALKGHSPCAHCTGNARYSNEEASALMLERGATPKEPYPGANRKWHCTCNSCQRDIYPTFNNARKFSACKYCAEQGFDQTAPSIAYLLRLDIDERHRVVKVGVANNDSGRLEKHESRGWVVLEVVETVTGEEALAVEQEVIRVWREMGIEPIAKQHIPNGDGWTETADAERAADVTPTLEKVLTDIRANSR